MPGMPDGTINNNKNVTSNHKKNNNRTNVILHYVGKNNF